MAKYFENLNEKIKEYFKILSPEIPEFLEVYLVVHTIQNYFQKLHYGTQVWTIV